MSSNGGSEDAIRLTIPAKPEYISLCRLALSGLARVRPLGDETLADLKLAITEAASNCVRHAYGEDEGLVEVVYQVEPDRLVIEVADNGTGFELAEGDGNPSDLSEGGLGIAIIRAIADEFDMTSGEQGSRLRVAKLLEE